MPSSVNSAPHSSNRRWSRRSASWIRNSSTARSVSRSSGSAFLAAVWAPLMSGRLGHMGEPGLELQAHRHFAGAGADQAAIVRTLVHAELATDVDPLGAPAF